mgnify:CR=1 FL=1|tara:strand:- start:116 stop:355 length:240 start_codon:yes stop_codon:yes gene_type:complete
MRDGGIKECLLSSHSGNSLHHFNYLFLTKLLQKHLRQENIVLLEEMLAFKQEFNCSGPSYSPPMTSLTPNFQRNRLNRL